MYIDNSVNYGKIGQEAMEARSKERTTGMLSQAKAESAGLNSMGYAKSAQLSAQAGVQAAKAGASATTMQGLMGGLSSLAGGFAARGGQNSADYTNKVDFGDGKYMMANDNGRLLHTNFDFRLPDK